VTIEAVDEVMQSTCGCRGVVKEVHYPSKEETVGNFIQRAVMPLGSDTPLGALSADPLEELFGAEAQGSGMWLVGVRTPKDSN
jgi:hypothetical protein